jgi:aldehyde dehydrogenase (NAD+)
MAPFIGAIAAGNCAVLKPSEISANTSALIADLVPRYLDQDCLRVVEGGVPETTNLLDQRWDHIFYTGNGVVGRIVMAAAAKHLTPVTLELGGKSPAIVGRSADLEMAAKRIAWGKFWNAGQTCVAPDYVLVHEHVHDRFIAQLRTSLREFYGDDVQASPDYGRIINEHHFQRLQKLLGSGDIAIGGQVDPGDRYIAPTVLVNVPHEAPVMGQEIFGPILPVLRIRDIDDAIAFVNARPKPLALYVFAKDRLAQQRILGRTSSGGATVNHAWMHLTVPGLPFGGVGESGMGAYHGKATFDVFTHRKSVLKKSTLVDPPLVYPPYSDIKERWIKRLL